MSEDHATVIGVPRETVPGERRVALVPKVVPGLRSTGFEVVVEAGAGAGALIPDGRYEEAGAVIGDPWLADVVAKVAPPTEEEIARLVRGQVLVGFLEPLTEPDRVRALAAAGVHGLAVESIPRITSAQAMDALSSQQNVAGYLAVLLAAGHLPRFFPMLTTAAGTVPPARVLVVGAGVAGLQALATARRLGARATGYDVRPEVAEQVRSVGADWLDLGVEAGGEGGYARSLTETERSEQQRRLTEAIGGFDVVITTAQVPGQPAPTLVTVDALMGMPTGGVVVDLAASSGGNCALSRPDEMVVEHGVTILAPVNLPAAMPEHASELYARNVQALLELLVDAEGGLRLDFDDEIIAAACVTRKEAEA